MSDDSTGTTLTLDKLQLCMSLAGLPVGTIMAGAFVDVDATATVIIVERMPAPGSWLDHTRNLELSSAELAQLVDDIALAAKAGADTDTHWANGTPRLLTPEAFDRLSAEKATARSTSRSGPTS